MRDHDGSGSSIFSKSHATSSSSNIFGRDSSRIIGAFGSNGGSILIQLHGCGGKEGKELKMMEEEVLVDVCERLGQITNSEDALRDVWRQITGTGRAKSHNVMHMQHKHGSDNQLAAALLGWLEEGFVDVAGGGIGYHNCSQSNSIYYCRNRNTCVADANCLSASLSWAWDNAPDEPGGRGSKSVTHLTYSVLKLVLQALPHFTRSFQILSHHLPLPAASVPSAIFIEMFSRHFCFPHSSSAKLFEGAV